MEFFMGAYINKNGNRYKLTRNGRSTKSTINLYINGKLHKVCKSAKEARKIGRNA